jgi:prepilin-type N-terminal cleavage/methylation domain-containing protein
MRVGRSGFTLLEIVLVVTIVGVMTGFTVYRFGPAFTRARVRAAANVIAGDLQQAQVLAARERQPIVLDLDASARTYEIRDRAASTVYVGRSFASGSDYAVDTLIVTATVVEFFPNGLTSGSATFRVATGAGYAREVTLTRAGQIRVRSGS